MVREVAMWDQNRCCADVTDLEKDQGSRMRCMFDRINRG